MWKFPENIIHSLGTLQEVYKHCKYSTYFGLIDNQETREQYRGWLTCNAVERGVNDKPICQENKNSDYRLKQHTFHSE